MLLRDAVPVRQKGRSDFIQHVRPRHSGWWKLDRNLMHIKCCPGIRTIRRHWFVGHSGLWQRHSILGWPLRNKMFENFGGPKMFNESWGWRCYAAREQRQESTECSHFHWRFLAKSFTESVDGSMSIQSSTQILRNAVGMMRMSLLFSLIFKFKEFCCWNKCLRKNGCFISHDTTVLSTGTVYILHKTNSSQFYAISCDCYTDQCWM